MIDLKMIKDRDEEYEMVNEEMLDDAMIESPASVDSGSERFAAVAPFVKFSSVVLHVEHILLFKKLFKIVALVS